MVTGSETGTDGRRSAAGRLTEEDLASMMPTRTLGREAKVGAFVLLGLLAFLTVLFTMTDVGTFRGRYYTQAVVPTAGGMRAGDPVQMRGVNIGRVKGFEIVPNGVQMELEIYDRYRVPEDSRVEVASSGLLGGMVVNVLPGDDEEVADEDDVLPGSVEAGIFAAASDVGERADVVLQRAAQLLSQQNVGALSASAQQLQTLLAELSALTLEQRRELTQLQASLRRSAAGVEGVATAPELESTLQQLDALTAQFEEASQKLNRASGSLETVLGRVERGEGTLGRLAVDDSLYVSLTSAVANLDQLVNDIRADPRRYLNVSVF